MTALDNVIKNLDSFTNQEIEPLYNSMFSSKDTVKMCVNKVSENYCCGKEKFIENFIWKPKSTLKIGFLNNNDLDKSINTTRPSGEIDPISNEILNLSSIDAVKKVVTERVIPIVDLNIIFVDDPKDANIRVNFDTNNEGSWSYVGTDSLNYSYPEPTVNFSWLDAPTIMHEFGHVLAMEHSHQNPYYQLIEWNKPKLYIWAKYKLGWTKQMVDENIINNLPKEEIVGAYFDPLSIMTYFVPNQLTLNDVGINQVLKYSGLDVEWINKVYGLGGTTLTPNQFYEQTYNTNIVDAVDQSNIARFNIVNNSRDVILTKYPEASNIPHFNLSNEQIEIISNELLKYLRNKSYLHIQSYELNDGLNVKYNYTYISIIFVVVVLFLIFLINL
jgi:hypothetical protein